MGLKTFTVDFSELSKISSLLLTTRIKEYQQNNNLGFLPFAYYLDKNNKFFLGQIKREHYKVKGTFPIIDQSQKFIAGYSDKNNLVYSGKLPVIIFGDHTRIFKYVNFPFIQGADGIQIIKPNEAIVNTKFFYYLLSKINVPSRGYNRHFSLLKKQKYPLISKLIQDQIVIKIERIEKKIKELKTQIKEPKKIIDKVFARKFEFNLRKVEELKKEKFFEVDFSKLAIYHSARNDVKYHKNTPVFEDFFNKYNYITLNKISLSEPMYGANESGIDGDKDKDTRYIRITDVDYFGNLIDSDWKTAEKVEEKYLLENNDFLFARSGNTVGKSFLYDSQKFEKAIFAGYFIKFQLDFSIINRLYFLYYTKSFIFDLWKDGIVRITGQPNINANEYLELKIPIISLCEQQKIIDEIKTKLNKQEQIKQQIEIERSKIDEIIEKAII